MGITFCLFLRNYNIDSLIIPNGVSTKKWVIGSSRRFQENYGIKPGFCLYAGRLSIEKGPDFFVEVAKRMPNTDTDKTIITIVFNILDEISFYV